MRLNLYRSNPVIDREIRMLFMKKCKDLALLKNQSATIKMYFNFGASGQPYHSQNSNWLTTAISEAQNYDLQMKTSEQTGYLDVILFLCRNIFFLNIF